MQNISRVQQHVSMLVCKLYRQLIEYSNNKCSIWKELQSMNATEHKKLLLLLETQNVWL